MVRFAVSVLVSVPKLIPEFIVPWGPRSDTSPVGVPGEPTTVAVAVTEVPWTTLTAAPPLSVRVVVVLLKLPTAVGQAVARFATFTEPSPVA